MPWESLFGFPVILSLMSVDEAQPETISKDSNKTTVAGSVNKSADNSGASNALENILQDLEQKDENDHQPRDTENRTLNQSPTETIKQITESLTAEPRSISSGTQ